MKGAVTDMGGAEFCRKRRSNLDHFDIFCLCRLADGCIAQTLRGLSALNCLGVWSLSSFLNNLQLWDPNCLLNDLHLWNLDVLGHLVDLLLDDGLLSLHCLLDDFGHLCFNCVDDVVNMRVRNLLRPFCQRRHACHMRCG